MVVLRPALMMGEPLAPQLELDWVTGNMELGVRVSAAPAPSLEGVWAVEPLEKGMGLPGPLVKDHMVQWL